MLVNFLFINFFARQFTFGALSWIFLELLWLHGSKAKSKQADIGACDWLQGHRLLYVVFVCSHDVLPPFFSSLIWTVYFLLSDNYRQVASFQEGSGLKGSRDRLSLSLTHTQRERERGCVCRLNTPVVKELSQHSIKPVNVCPQVVWSQRQTHTERLCLALF